VRGETVPYETGVARYREIARGQILGDHSGMFKMLFHRENRRLLGIHCIGTGATELVHVGQAVLGLGGGLDYFMRTVFNYPTLAECYNVAALDASNKLLVWSPPGVTYGFGPPRPFACSPRRVMHVDEARATRLCSSSVMSHSRNPKVFPRLINRPTARSLAVHTGFRKLIFSSTVANVSPSANVLASAIPLPASAIPPT